jgi:hypothetical protein
MVRIRCAVDALDRLRIVPVDDNAEHHGLGSCVGDEVVCQVHHEFWLVASAGWHRDEVRVADVRNTLVAHHSVSFLRDEIVDEFLHARFCCWCCRLEANHNNVGRDAIT